MLAAQQAAIAVEQSPLVIAAIFTGLALLVSTVTTSIVSLRRTKDIRQKAEVIEHKVDGNTTQMLDQIQALQGHVTTALKAKNRAEKAEANATRIAARVVGQKPKPKPKKRAR